MGFLSALFSGGDAVKAVGDTLDNVFTSDDERLERENEKARAAMDCSLKDRAIDFQFANAQVELNKIEGGRSEFFHSGWRPALGWTCVISVFSYYVPYCLIATALWAHQVLVTGQLVSRPDLGIADLFGLLTSMLGLNVMRSWEKSKGVAKG
ncbi:MAG TPA: 3TM-type holin [Cellvibrionaceae bacterium]|nr:3TM-type holin [Cellvibrionaceae bacterium]